MSQVGGFRARVVVDESEVGLATSSFHLAGWKGEKINAMVTNGRLLRRLILFSHRETATDSRTHVGRE